MAITSNQNNSSHLPEQHRLEGMPGKTVSLVSDEYSREEQIDSVALHGYRHIDIRAAHDHSLPRPTMAPAATRTYINENGSLLQVVFPAQFNRLWAQMNDDCYSIIGLP